MPKNVVDLPFEVGDAGRQEPSTTWIRCHGLHREDFNADIDDVAAVEEQMFDEQIKSNKSVLTELHLDSHAVFNKVGLLVGQDRVSDAFTKQVFFLFLQRQLDNVFNICTVRCHVVTVA